MFTSYKKNEVNDVPNESRLNVPTGCETEATKYKNN